MGRLVQKGQRPLGAEHLARNVKGTTRTTGVKGAAAATLIKRIMRDHDVSRGEAVAIMNAERARHMAEWTAKDFDPEARERFEDRQTRREVRAIIDHAERASRVTAFLDSIGE